MIVEDSVIQTAPDTSFFSIAQDRAAQDRLFIEIRKFLNERGIQSGFRLGEPAQHDELSLMCVDGYWVVFYSERGDSSLRGVFISFIDATEFLLLRLLDSRRYDVDFTRV